MRRPSRVFLHAGHGKTGSSFLQSALALSVPTLHAAGIAYPIDEEVAVRARAGGITAGNFRSSPRLFRSLIEDGWDGPEDQLLLSSESLFHMALKDMPRKIRRRLPDADVQVLLFIRDPLDHAVSQYQQAVKRGGWTGDFADFLNEYDLPSKVNDLMTPLLETGFTLTVRNYSRHRDRLLAVTEEWLGLAPDSLTRPATAQVNRSMTNAEIALQRAFNQHMPRGAGALVSDPLCQALPEIASERPPVEPAVLTAFLERMQASVAANPLDGHIPPEEMYRLPDPEEAVALFARPDAEERFCFSQAQLDVVAEAICTALGHADPAGPAPQPERRDA